MPTPKQVPLVMYQSGIRTVLGTATIKSDGSVEAQIADDVWPSVREFFLPSAGEFSLNTAPKVKIVNEPSTDRLGFRQE